MQILQLESAMWEKVREVIILPPILDSLPAANESGIISI